MTRLLTKKADPVTVKSIHLDNQKLSRAFVKDLLTANKQHRMRPWQIIYIALILL